VACAALLHPLMAIYLGAMALTLWMARWQRARRLAALPALAVLAAGGICILQRGVVESPAYIQAVLTRSYFYLEDWHWYESLGIVLPVLLLFGLAAVMRSRCSENARAVALAAAVGGVSVSLVSMVYVHRGSASHLLARLQVLREFQFVYLLMFLLVGALVGRYVLRQAAWRWAAYLCLLVMGLFMVQRATYPSSQQMEAPWRETRNPWTQAFLWARAHTPRDAVFALDAHYITAEGEDAQGFRAIAERSALADYSKDGGAAAIFPELAEQWRNDVTATTGLDGMSDEQRKGTLRPLGVTWLVLRSSTATLLACPYRNSEIAVCRL
jgi:hypothetical protein